MPGCCCCWSLGQSSQSQFLFPAKLESRQIVTGSRPGVRHRLKYLEKVVNSPWCQSLVSCVLYQVGFESVLEVFKVGQKRFHLANF